MKNVAAVLHKSLSVALKQWLIQQNPCDATGMPKAQKPEIQLLSDSEIPVFLSACAQDAMGRAFVLCLLAGLRGASVWGFHGMMLTPLQAESRYGSNCKKKKKGGKYYIAPTKSAKVGC